MFSVKVYVTEKSFLFYLHSPKQHSFNDLFNCPKSCNNHVFIICADNSPYGKKAQMEKDVTCNSDNLCTIKQSVTLVKKTDVQSSWINRFKKAALLENKAAETPSSSGLACAEFRLDPNSAGIHLKLTQCNFGLRSFPVTVRHDYIMRRKNNSVFFSVLSD